MKALELVDVKVTRDAVVGSECQRAREVRGTLLYQQGFETATEAEAQFGLLMSEREIHERIIALMSRWKEWSLVNTVIGAALMVCAVVFFTLVFPGMVATANSEVSRQGPASARMFVGALLGVTVFFIGVAMSFGTRKPRRTRWEPMQSYRGYIPDAALLRYDEAQESGKFSAFYVVEPTYEERHAPDPWLVGVVKGRNRDWESRNERTMIVLAYWD